MADVWPQGLVDTHPRARWSKSWWMAKVCFVGYWLVILGAIQIVFTIALYVTDVIPSSVLDESGVMSFACAGFAYPLSKAMEDLRTGRWLR